MSDDLGAMSSSAPEQEVERVRRLALSRLDELEASFYRVSERLVSVEARLGELAEDLRVRVTALQQQTRDAVAASLQMLAPQRDTADIKGGLEEIRAEVRADVQEIAASIRATFVEAEQRLLDEQASFLERAGVTGESLAARTDGLSQAVESLRQQIAATGGTDEVRSAIESLRAEVAASKEGEELRATIAALRQEVVNSTDVGDVRGAVESLRQDVAAQIEGVRATVSEPAPAVDVTERLGAFQEELRALGESVRDAAATAREGAGATERDTGGLEETAATLTSAVEALREQTGEIARRTEAIDQRAASVEERATSIDERLSGGTESSARFDSALEAAVSSIDRRLGEFHDQLESAVQSLGERPPTGAEGLELTALEGHLGQFREQVEESVKALNSQSLAQVEQVKGEIEGWMTRFGEILEGSLSALRHRLEGVSAGDGEAVRSEVGAMAQRVQEQMNRLEASVHELRDRPAFAPPAPEPEVAAEPAVTMQPVEEAAPPAPPEPEPPDESGAAEEASGTLESPAGTEVEETSDADGRGETGEDEPAPEEELPPPPPPAEVAEPAEPVEPAEGEEPDPGSKKLPDIWSWGPKQS
jgi:hypothetical protein